MRVVICWVLVVVPLVAGLLRSRHWLATQWSGPLGAVWCVAVGALAGSVPGLLAGARLGLFAVLALPLLGAAGVLLLRKPARPGTPAVPAAPVTDAAEAGSPPPAAAPAKGVPARTPPPARQGPPMAPPLTAAKAAVQEGSQGEASVAPSKEAARPGGPSDGPAPAAAAASPTVPAPQRPPRPSPAVAALRAIHAGTENEKGAPQPESSANQPTTVTECILTMSISCEEYMLRNLHEMARSPLPESQRDTLTRLIEETDDKLARLRAAVRRHHGEELVRATWNQLPEVDLPVVKPGATLAQIRDKAMRQTQVMIDFYRTVASYAQRPSLKNLLVNLALDGQRHLAVIEQTG